MGFVERVFADFDAAIVGGIRRMGSMQLPQVIKSMPRPLFDLVWANTALTVQKLVQDHMLHLEVATKVDMRGLKMDLVKELRCPRPAAPACLMWNPDVGRGCSRGAACPDRHDISPALL
jgi:hypothetical protein